MKKRLADPTVDQELERSAKEKMRSAAKFFDGDFDEKVAVLGAFDTWPYMDYVCRILANNNYVAVTSRYVYRKINDRIMRLRTQEHLGFAGQYHFMGILLDQIISSCASAIVNFSVSAAHFIEIDWCHRKSKRTLGITYARAISGLEKGSCENLQIVETDRGSYSICKIGTGEARTVWDCMKSATYCPFIRQDISKNVIEYFFRGKGMESVALEDVGVLPLILGDRYPPLTTGNPRIDFLDDDIMKDDEVVFTKDCIYFILRLKKLARYSFVKHLSPMKMATMLQKLPGWSESIASNLNRLRYFVSKKLKEEELVCNLKDGFVDIDLIGTKYINLAGFLKKRGYIKLRKIQTLGGPQVNLAKMTPRGEELSNIYLKL